MEIDGVRLKQARETVYLGVRLSEDGGMERGLAWLHYSRLLIFATNIILVVRTTPSLGTCQIG